MLDGGGCDSSENGVRVRAALKALFLIFPDHFLRPHFRIFQFLTILYSLEITNFLENLHFKASKLEKSSVLMPKIWSNFLLKNLKLEKKNQFVMTSKLAEVHSLRTYFRPKRAAHPPHSYTHIKMKVN